MILYNIEKLCRFQKYRYLGQQITHKDNELNTLHLPRGGHWAVPRYLFSTVIGTVGTF